MAKELPYFKFEPSLWDSGKIQMCSLEAQGLFINICSLYWLRLGDLPERLVLRKLCGGDDTLIYELIENEVLSIINDSINIGFLNNQLKDFQSISKERAKAGQKGGTNGIRAIDEARIKGNKIYALYCFDESEQFIKTGITSESISRRFSGRLPYKYKLLYSHLTEDNLSLEVDIENVLSRHTYRPDKRFDGYKECFSVECIDLVHDFFKNIGAKIVQSVSKAESIREDKIREDKIREEYTPKPPQGDSENFEQSAIAESEKKEKISAEKERRFGKSEFGQSLLDHGANPQHVDDWLKVRTAKRATFTETALNRFLNECENNNFPVAEAVRICAEKSWQGFEYQWILNQQSNARTTKTNDLSNLKRLSEGVMVAVESGYVPRRDN